MNVYEVISTNLDVNDGFFVNVLFDNIDKAFKFCKEELEGKEPNNVTEDFEGLLQSFQDKSLEYAASYNNPAIYYNSHYGNYRCVVFIKIRKVY